MSSISFWNCRGAWKKRASLYIKEFVKDNGVLFLALLETKSISFNRSEINTLIGEDWDYSFVPSEGLSGGIVILWKSLYSSFKILETNQQFIIGDLEVFNKCIWRIGFVYANKDVYKRRSLWERLQIYSCNDIPMVIGGDFNCLLNKEDKKGGKRFFYALGSREMDLFLASNDLHEVNRVGPKFTWSNNKSGADKILEHLDHCYLNSMALCSPHRILVKHLARIASDHCPILLNLFESKAEFKKLIRFEDIWISNPASSSLVKKIWEKKSIGDHSQNLNLKMRKTLKALFYWNKENFRIFNSSKDTILGDIQELQKRESIDGFLSEKDSWIRKSKISDYNSTLAKINTWWRQRAKIKWATQGDSNTKFFHTFASARKNANFINSILNSNGLIVEDQHQIENSFVSFFENKWRNINCILDNWPFPITKLNEDDVFSLNTEFSFS
ncbi:uncharacterized protein LOC110114567 [Dendrobium catenatum]|uniref:uncharacterized protein LOC110114567 n=1 Tax=Dendrobium catenatum TaxID=906689 RepID=UPI0009F18EE3|nr:uncharacterized protein LOC110114567 [Dendrobium catenatum]